MMPSLPEHATPWRPQSTAQRHSQYDWPSWYTCGDGAVGRADNGTVIPAWQLMDESRSISSVKKHRERGMFHFAP